MKKIFLNLNFKKFHFVNVFFNVEAWCRHIQYCKEGLKWWIWNKMEVLCETEVRNQEESLQSRFMITFTFQRLNIVFEINKNNSNVTCIWIAECIVELVKFSICCGATWLYDFSKVAKVFAVLLKTHTREIYIYIYTHFLFINCIIQNIFMAVIWPR